MKSIKKTYNVLLSITFFFALTPYIKTSPLNSDTQPHFYIFFIFTLLILIFSKRKIPLNYIGLFLSLFYFFLAIALNAKVSDAISIFFLILTVTFIINAVDKNRKNIINILGKVVVFTSIFYLCFSILEISLGYSVIENILSNPRKSANRGIISATSEPSFLGLISLALILLAEVTKPKGYKKIQLINTINLLVSFSSAVIVPFIFIILLYTINKKSYRVAFLVTLISIILVISIPYISLPERLEKLVSNSNNLEYILSDQSFVNRIARSLLPITNAFSSYLAPHQMDVIQFNENNFLSKILLTDYDVNRLSSSLGVFLYGFGFLSLPIILVYMYSIIKLKTPLYIIISIIFFSTANISIATPYVLLIFTLPWLNKPNHP